MKSTLMLSFVVVLLAGGCTWVKPIEQAEHVQVLETVSSAESCQRLGSTSVSVKDKVGFVKRGEDKVARELETLARNEAAKMGGNAVLAKSDSATGAQEFFIYRCP
ncbi:DUF4156 domain-containing protein [Teredinibacter turnerae]|uniref:DUF4156 domain-containing protein n=1 Tax=Teredinibacter turnerae TaxID=2426 RepID=UPI00037B2D5A|nr:DUF4156 domain-containing protein [Teredinibacter turnerae]